MYIMLNSLKDEPRKNKEQSNPFQVMENLVIHIFLLSEFLLEKRPKKSQRSHAVSIIRAVLFRKEAESRKLLLLLTPTTL